MNHADFLVQPGKSIRLKDFDPGSTGGYKNKDELAGKLAEDIQRLETYQAMLYAENRRSVLIVLQAMDTAGKDGTIRHVLTGVNPMGVEVHSFKAPSTEELAHDYLWRTTKALPERGKIGIFNRSHYEEVLVVRVHPEFLAAQRLPADESGDSLWKHRFEQINAYEEHLARNGTVILKFYLHLSKDEQKRRLLERIDTPEKNWKFSAADLKERAHWDEYLAAYEDAINNTSTKWAPWYVIPADHKWFTRAAVADIVADTLKSLDLAYPTLDQAQLRELAVCKVQLQMEK